MYFFSLTNTRIIILICFIKKYILSLTYGKIISFEILYLINTLE